VETLFGRLWLPDRKWRKWDDRRISVFFSFKAEDTAALAGDCPRLFGSLRVTPLICTNHIRCSSLGVARGRPETMATE